MNLNQVYLSTTTSLLGLLFFSGASAKVLNHAEFNQKNFDETIRVTQRYNLSGQWRDDVGSICEIEQNDNQFSWQCQDSQIPPRWVNVFEGIVRGNIIEGNWKDIPPGSNRLSGTLQLKISSPHKTLSIKQEFMVLEY